MYRFSVISIGIIFPYIFFFFFFSSTVGDKSLIYIRFIVWKDPQLKHSSYILENIKDFEYFLSSNHKESKLQKEFYILSFSWP